MFIIGHYGAQVFRIDKGNSGKFLVCPACHIQYNKNTLDILPAYVYYILTII